MIKAFICYEVPVEKQDKYLRFAAEKLKLFFRLRGARIYEVYQNASLED
jgi:hypothetical protein